MYSSGPVSRSRGRFQVFGGIHGIDDSTAEIPLPGGPSYRYHADDALLAAVGKGCCRAGTWQAGGGMNLLAVVEELLLAESFRSSGQFE